MYRCLTCGAEKKTQIQINGHVINHHLPDDWTDDDLKQTSEKVKNDASMR